MQMIFFHSLSVTDQLVSIYLDAYRSPVMTTCLSCDRVSIFPPHTFFFLPPSPLVFFNYLDVFGRTQHNRSPSYWSALGWAHSYLLVSFGMSDYQYPEQQLLRELHVMDLMFVCSMNKLNAIPNRLIVWMFGWKIKVSPLLITIPRIRFFALAKSRDAFADLKLKTVVLYSIRIVWWRVWRECNFDTKVTGLWTQHFRSVGTFGNLFMNKLPGTWKTPNNIRLSHFVVLSNSGNSQNSGKSLKIQGNLIKNLINYFEMRCTCIHEL